MIYNSPIQNTGFNPYATPANPYAPNPAATYMPATSYVPQNPANVQPASNMTAQNQNAAQMNQATQATSGPFIVVNGVQGAKDVQVPPNQTAWMMDQNVQQFYVKSADNLGICKMDYYRFEKFDPDIEAQQKAQEQAMAQQQQFQQNANFMTRDEVESLINEKVEMFKNMIQPAPEPKQSVASKTKKD